MGVKTSLSVSLKELKSVGLDLSHDAADLPVNRPKNRYTNILPCECSSLTSRRKRMTLILHPLATYSINTISYTHPHTPTHTQSSQVAKTAVSTLLNLLCFVYCSYRQLWNIDDINHFFFQPDDFSRVKLISMHNDEGSDYINANYIPVSIYAAPVVENCIIITVLYVYVQSIENLSMLQW